jgi:hypothetical protein
MYFPLRRVGSPQQGDVADALHEFGAAFPAQGLDHLVAAFAIAGPDAYFHQFMMIERAIELGQEPWRDAGIAGQHHGLKRMSKLAKMFFMFFRQRHRVFS